MMGRSLRSSCLRVGRLALGGALVATACGDDASDDAADVTTATATESSTGAESSTSTSGTSTQEGSSSETGPIFDVGNETEGTGGFDHCKVNDDMDAPGPCGEQAPPDSFQPEVQWTWSTAGGGSMVTPLVVNLTDDNDDGSIDLCDTPDVIAVIVVGQGSQIHVLDGLTGTLHFAIETIVAHYSTPAIGDIDGDGLPEIVAPVYQGEPGDMPRKLGAFEHDGTLKWVSDTATAAGQTSAIALADLDNDGDVEIIADNRVADHDGNLLFEAPDAASPWPYLAAPTAADLDGDGDLELVLGRSAYHHDGSEAWLNPSAAIGFPQVGNLDADEDPEVLIIGTDGISVLEHDGQLKYQGLTPTGDPPGNGWFRPAAIHDFDGDEIAEFAVSSVNNYATYHADASILWVTPVVDGSGRASGTAFDFLGDATAEAMYADETTLYVFDDMGGVLLSAPRASWTQIEYPIVADVDNDGSAEIVVVGIEEPNVQVIRDQQDRWVPARRIWNQHSYHVTNVREDATIPQFEPPHWKTLNTFRTQAQIDASGVCEPEG